MTTIRIPKIRVATIGITAGILALVGLLGFVLFWIGGHAYQRLTGGPPLSGFFFLLPLFMIVYVALGFLRGASE